MRGVADESWMQTAEGKGGGLYVRFNLESRKNEKKSLEAGRPVHEDVEYIQIIVPGQADSIIHRAVRPGDAEKFPREYAAFKAGLEGPQSGTPLKDWLGISRSQADDLAHFKVFTVEQLAELSDASVQNLGPIIGLRQKARDYLKRAAEEAPVGKLEAALAERDAELQALKAQMKEQAGAIASLRKKKAKEGE